jgi:hypothetical protein
MHVLRSKFYKHSYVVKVKVKLGSIAAMKYEFLLPSVTRIFRSTETLAHLYQLYSIQEYVMGHSGLFCFAHVFRQPNVNVCTPSNKMFSCKCLCYCLWISFFTFVNIFQTPFDLLAPLALKLQAKKLSLFNLSKPCRCT